MRRSDVFVKSPLRGLMFSLGDRVLKCSKILAHWYHHHDKRLQRVLNPADKAAELAITA